MNDVEFENVTVIASTDKAFLLAQEGQSAEDAEWFPKSQIDWTEPAERGDQITVYIPDWLVEKKGW